MTKAKKIAFEIADATINHIAGAEAKITGLKADSKANSEAANSHKIGAYCELISSIASVKMKKGNLPDAVSKSVKEALLLALGTGKDATVKRYFDNSVGAIRHFDLAGMTQATPAMVQEFFDAEGITSENKLAKLVSGEASKSKAKLLAEKVVGKWSTKREEGKKVQGDKFCDGLSDEELEEFHNIMRELLAARKAFRNTAAAKAAEADAAAENSDVDAAVDAMMAS